jgi:antitoxin MazE
MMLAKVQKWGNSLSLRIPKAFAAEASVEEGSTVDISVGDGEIIVRPVRARAFRLQDLLSEITKENLHDEVDAGAPQGRESW